MSVALDIGSTEFRSLRRESNRFIARRVPAFYCVFAKTNEKRRLLEQLHAPFSITEDYFLVIGEPALDVARTLSHPLVPIIHHGQLPYDDPIGRQVCAALIESLIPSTTEPTLCLSNLPVATTHAPADAGLIDHVVRLRGYQFARGQAARAAILSELEDAAYSGVAITVGAESVTMALAQSGQTQFTESYGRGARSIEEQFAQARHRFQWDCDGNKYLDLQSVRDWQRKGAFSLITPQDGDEQALAEAYYRLLTDAFAAMLPEMMRKATREWTSRRWPVVLAGGPTRLIGFPQIVAHALEASRLPCRFGDIRLATYEPYTIARGLFIEATLHTEDQLGSAVA